MGGFGPRALPPPEMLLKGLFDPALQAFMRGISDMQAPAKQAASSVKTGKYDARATRQAAMTGTMGALNAATSPYEIIDKRLRDLLGPEAGTLASLLIPFPGSKLRSATRLERLAKDPKMLKKMNESYELQQLLRAGEEILAGSRKGLGKKIGKIADDPRTLEEIKRTQPRLKEQIAALEKDIETFSDAGTLELKIKDTKEYMAEVTKDSDLVRSYPGHDPQFVINRVNDNNKLLQKLQDQLGKYEEALASQHKVLKFEAPE